MKTFSRFIVATICALTIAGTVTNAQDLQQQLSKLGHDAAVSYATPILSGWGNDLNSGIYYSADLHDILGFDVGARVAMMRITDGDKTFTLTMPSSMTVKPSDLGINSINGIQIPSGSTITLTAGSNYPASVTANTAVGANQEVDVKTTGGNAVVKNGSTVVGTVPVPAGTTILPLPPGYDLGSLGVPLPMPQFDLGLPFGLEFMLRYVPTITAGDYGKFNYMGFGLRYSIDQWIPLCPVDIAVHFMIQKLNFKSKDDQDIFNASSNAFGAEVSKRFFILTLFGGFQIENSTLTLSDYQYLGSDPSYINPATGKGITIQGFEVKGSNKARFTVGARLLLLFLNVHAEYSIATNPVIVVGAGITLR